MRFCLIASLLTFSLTAQTAPSPEQEQALRERVTKFYTALQESKFKAAFAMVADDAQDAFMGMSKVSPKTFAVDKIEWLDGDKQAKVYVAIERDVNVMGRTIPGKMRDESYWRIEEGAWVWFQPPVTEIRTPLGTFKRPQATGEPPPKIDFKEKMSQAPSDAELTNSVKVKATTLEFSLSKPGTGRIVVENGMPGWVIAKVWIPEVPGFSVSTTQENIAAGQSLEIKFTWTPGARPKLEDNYCVLNIEPLNRRYEFKIIWKD